MKEYWTKLGTQILYFQIIFRLYDQDGDNVVTSKEIGKISSLLREPEVANRFAGGVKNLMEDMEKVDLDR